MAADELTELFSVPLNEFTSKRNQLARTLRESGESERAAEISKLRKPTLPAWAVNQLAHNQPDDIAQLIENSDALQNASGASELRRLTDERHAIVRSLVAAAREILQTHGLGASASTLQEVTRTLYAATTDENKDRIRRGLLDRPLESAGFDQPFELSPDAAVYEAPRTTRLEGELEDVEVELAAAQREADEAQRHARKLAAEASAAEQGATQARRRVERLTEKRDRLQEKLHH